MLGNTIVLLSFRGGYQIEVSFICTRFGDVQGFRLCVPDGGPVLPPGGIRDGEPVLPPGAYVIGDPSYHKRPTMLGVRLATMARLAPGIIAIGSLQLFDYCFVTIAVILR